MAKNYSLIGGLSLGNSSSGKHLGNLTVKDDDDFYDDVPMDVFDAKADVLPIVLAVLIVLANSWVLVLMFRKKYLRTLSNMLLCSLAISDLLTGLVYVPLFIACNVIRKSAICIIEDQMSRFISASIVCHLLSANTDRYLAIMHPLRYTTLVTRSRCLLCIVFIWSASTVTALVQLSWLDPVHHDVYEEVTDDVKRSELIYDVVFLTLFIAVPFVFTCFTYVRILLEIVRQSRTIQRQNLPGMSSTKTRIGRERKAIAIFAAMVFVYLICWLPYFSLRRIGISQMSPFWVYFILWLRFLASLLNPCMYILGKRDFRKASFKHSTKVAKLEMNIASSSNSSVLKASLALCREKDAKVYMKSFSRIGSPKTRPRNDI